MDKRVPAIMLVTAAVLGACEKTGEGEYEVKRPTVSVTTDTVQFPTVDVGTDTVRLITPDVDVTVPGKPARRDSASVDTGRSP